MFKLTNLVETRKSFLSQLPNETFKKVVIKIILLFSIGILVSSILAILGVGVVELTNLTSNFSFSLIIFLQNIGFLSVTLLLFYKGNLGETITKNKKETNKLRCYLVGGNILFILLLFSVIAILSLMFNKLDSIESYQKIVDLGEDKVTVSYIGNYLLTLLTFLFIAFSEEFVFRHTIYRFLRRYGMVLAILVSSILFYIVHEQIIHIGFIYGVILCLYYEYTNDFKGLVLTHTINNILLTFVPFYVAYIVIWLFT